jgi:hypothetical protein
MWLVSLGCVEGLVFAIHEGDFTVATHSRHAHRHGGGGLKGSFLKGREGKFSEVLMFVIRKIFSRFIIKKATIFTVQ